MKGLRCRRARTPITATVFLAGITIAVAVLVAFWMSGVTGSYSKSERIDIQSSFCEWEESGTYWNVSIAVKNTGTTVATLDKVFINDIEVDSYGVGRWSIPDQGSATTTLPIFGMSLKSGETKKIYVFIEGPPEPQWQFVSSGTNLNIKLHSAGGMTYIRLIELV